MVSNSRTNFRANGSTAQVIKENHYYPFGLEMDVPWRAGQVGVENGYQYNGKELNEDFGLGWYDYGFRNFDPSVARFISKDILSEAIPNTSSYHYAMNNPIRFLDFMGLYPYTYNWSTGKYENEYGGEVEWREVKAHIDSEYPQLTSYVVNGTLNEKNTKYTLSTNSLSKTLYHASNIFEKNGFDNIKFKVLSTDEAKKLKLGEFDLFIGVLSSPNFPPGFTAINAFGEISTYRNNTLATYANYQWVVDNLKGDKIYGLGYLIAHELLHQLIIKSVKFLEGYQSAQNLLTFKIHENSIPNLNMAGPEIMQRNSFPSGPSTHLRPAEQILENHRVYLHSFLIWYRFEQALRK